MVLHLLHSIACSNKREAGIPTCAGGKDSDLGAAAGQIWFVAEDTKMSKDS